MKRRSAPFRGLGIYTVSGKTSQTLSIATQRNVYQF